MCPVWRGGLDVTEPISSWAKAYSWSGGVESRGRSGSGRDPLFHFLLDFLITKGSLSYLSSPCFSKNVLQSGVGIVH